MEAIGLNPIRLDRIGLDRIGLDPIRVNAIKLGVPGAASGSARPYIDPEVLASLVAVCICDGKSNDDPDRAVIKNLVDPDNPFVISNAAYKLNSGYGKYEEDFTTWRISKSGIVSTINVNSIHITRIKEPLPDSLAFFENRTTTNRKFNIKLKISGLTSDMKCTLNNQGSIIKELANGVNEISADLVAGWYGFTIIKLDGSIIGDCDVTITQIPSHQGAFVTDGKDDLIASTKTVSEMGITDEVTVVSLVHQVSLNSTYNKAFTNYLEILDGSAYIRNDVVNGDKTGIYGYTSKLNTNVATVINNILGDKSDYGSYSTNIYNSLSNTKFSVVGRISEFRETSSVAWYWTFIANKVLTTDQINQVISYFNLDKHVKPDIIYDTIRQGITNENHASFNDELVDFSGNGHNMKIYNSAWNKESGINDEGAWQTDGVTDYGQYVGDLGLKDYTIAVDRAYVEAKPSQVPIMSNVVDGSVSTPFLMEHLGIEKILAPHSFGKYTALSELDINRFISYQSTYKYNGIDITKGTSTNTGSGLTIGRIGGVASQYANIALWSLLLFPYSLSEFLLERQLKRYKLGTLYPNMVEFRPIVKSNREYSSISYSVNPGEYISVDSMVTITVTLPNTSDKLIDVSCNAISDISISGDNGVYEITGKVVKSPQKINIVISSYLTMLNNDTLISNETLIKNE